MTANIFTTDPAEHPDVARLLDLLELLPHSRGSASHALDEDFVRELRRVLGAELMVVWDNMFQTWSEDIPHAPHSWIPLQRLVDYLLEIVTHPSPELHPVFDRVRPISADDGRSAAGVIGRFWENDVATTAWHLYVSMEAAERRSLRIAP
ncbi:hypothetical protein [Saccharopolyspora phatthalungensis]|uniref:Uncharacterized protein n=1 Tax=Saccharopolyspora phatthalungensis TaxID=664693 RepID=A0A840Q841_9PSEU|nr:hypothetical protein [Saccharopolyspora phatthalungensis]MBB5156020.1 hypothetical protein [Saccharopolyspora phatthalungensis]